MRYWIILLSILAAALGVIACTSTSSKGGVGGPAHPDGPQFNHKSHLARGVDCGDCHGDAAVDFKQLPALEVCLQCHEELDAKNPPEKHAKPFFDDQGQGKWAHASLQGPEINFVHGPHVKAGTKCTECHQAVAEGEFIVTGGKLKMDDCQSCHGQKAPDKLDCAVCHKEIRAGQPPKSHKMGWKRQHGQIGKLGDYDSVPGECAYCHKKSDCDTCHRAEMPLTHNNLWRQGGHAAAASIDRDRCSVCHTTDSCYLCHRNTEPRTHRSPGWKAPFDRHCNTCHLPNEGFGDQGCAVCHQGTPGHLTAPPRPTNVVHQTTNPANCRECHTPPKHPDNGDSCLLCHH